MTSRDPDIEETPERSGFRKTIAGLHTWGGLATGWILFAIFLTGSLAVFDAAITRWMKPETRVLTDSEVREMNTDQADLARKGRAFLGQAAPRSDFWGIGMPRAEDPVIRLFYEDEQGRFQRERLDAVTGQPVPKKVERETEGGHHFVHMHYEFQAGTAGIWLAGFATMAMLVALVSGIVVHKRIFRDFFTFRVGKRQRSWLDAHNALSVLTLPFQFMIAYTGLVIFYAIYMPAGIQAYFGDRESFLQELRARSPEQGETGAGTSASVVALDGLLQRAEAELARSASFISIDNPGHGNSSVRVFGQFDQEEAERRLLGRNSGRVEFDGVTGKLLDVEMPGEFRGGGAYATERVMGALHFADFGGYTVRWLYFILGLAGAAMMGTGSVLFLVKRRQRGLVEFGIHTPRIHRVIEVLNVATIAGLTVACIGFFWVNRLIPMELEDRAAWEIRLFFAVWGLMLIHASCRRARRAWVEQTGLAAALCLLLPMLNALTTDAHLFNTISTGNWLIAGVDLTAFGIGLILVGTTWKIAASVADKPTAEREILSGRAASEG